MIKIGGGIKSIMLADWLNDFNPITEAPALVEENPPVSLFMENPVFKPMNELNRRKEQTKTAFLQYVDSVKLAGDEIWAVKTDRKLSNAGIMAKSKEITAAFIDASFKGFLLDEFKKNSQVIDSSIKTIMVPPKVASPEEAFMDFEIRNAHYWSNEAREAALKGDISPRVELALCRGDRILSGFDKDTFDIFIFSSAIRRNIKEAYRLDTLYSINCSLWMLAHRTIKSLCEFSKFLNDDEELTLNSLGLNWKGENLMSGLKDANYFINTAVKTDRNRLMASIKEKTV